MPTQHKASEVDAGRSTAEALNEIATRDGDALSVVDGDDMEPEDAVGPKGLADTGLLPPEGMPRR
jgi:hypothetical protein